jgi:hypothetical protein
VFPKKTIPKKTLKKNQGQKHSSACACICNQLAAHQSAYRIPRSAAQRNDNAAHRANATSPRAAHCIANNSAGCDRWSGKSAEGEMSEDHDRCFSILVLGAFSTGVFNTNALPRINIGAYVWGESSHHDRCLLTLVIVYFAHRMGSVLV